jgi:hypothetical protein
MNGGGGALDITGFQSTDILSLVQTFANSTITKTTNAEGQKITEIAFAGGFEKPVTINGWHDAVVFLGDPNIHYI